MVITKKMAKAYTQKEMSKEFKQFTVKHQVNTKEDSKIVNEEQKKL